MKADLPENENERLNALYELDLLDTPREQEFDDIAKIAAQVCQVPIAIVGLIDAERQWYKAAVGIDATEVPREISFCSHAMLDSENLTLVNDACQDKRFANSPVVLGEPHIRFYAGAPLTTPEGLVLGTLCVVDFHSRTLSEEQRESLSALARQVMLQIKLRRALKTAAKTSQQLNIITESVPALIGHLDATGRYSFCNPKYTEWWGIERATIIGKTPRAALGDAVADLLEPYMARSFAGEPVSFELPMHDNRVLDVHYVPQLQGTQVVGVFVLANDVSEHKRIEQMKNEFVSSVSHELRTPLTSISGALGLIVNQSLGEVPEQYKSLLDIAYKNSRRLTLLINDLLDMEKLLAGKMQFTYRQLPLGVLLEKALYENKTYADQYRIRFVLRDSTRAVFIQVDEHRFLQVMANLLSNAVKFSHPDASVEVFGEVIAGRVRVTVADRGVGIPLEFQPRIFQKFSQADATTARQKGGTGLGLAITRELVEKMDGQISFVSQPDKGTRFYIDFPISDAEV